MDISKYEKTRDEIKEIKEKKLYDRFLFFLKNSGREIRNLLWIKKEEEPLSIATISIRKRLQDTLLRDQQHEKQSFQYEKDNPGRLPPVYSIKESLDLYDEKFNQAIDEFFVLQQAGDDAEWKYDLIEEYYQNFINEIIDFHHISLQYKDFSCKKDWEYIEATVSKFLTDYKGFYDDEDL